MIEAQIEGDRRAAIGQKVIDAAVHNDVPSTRALYPFLPEYWVEHVEQTQFKGQAISTTRPTRRSPPARTAGPLQRRSRPRSSDAPAPPPRPAHCRPLLSAWSSARC
jgi:hypothetical protein